MHAREFRLFLKNVTQRGRESSLVFLATFAESLRP
jgi:hypothetical protein